VREIKRTLRSGRDEEIRKWDKQGVAVVVAVAEACGCGLVDIPVLLDLIEKPWLEKKKE